MRHRQSALEILLKSCHAYLESLGYLGRLKLEAIVIQLVEVGEDILLQTNLCVIHCFVDVGLLYHIM